MASILNKSVLLQEFINTYTSLNRDRRFLEALIQKQKELISETRAEMAILSPDQYNVRHRTIRRAESILNRHIQFQREYAYRDN